MYPFFGGVGGWGGGGGVKICVKGEMTRVNTALPLLFGTVVLVILKDLRFFLANYTGYELCDSVYYIFL